MRGQDPGHQTHGGAGVAAIERLGAGLQPAKAPADDFNRGLGRGAAPDRDPQRFEARQRGLAVRAGREVAHCRSAVGKRGQDGVTVRDGFVPGNPKTTAHGAGRRYDDGHDVSL